MASSTINQLKQDNIVWINEQFIACFEDKYGEIMLNVYEEITLLMYEAKLHYTQESILDVFYAGIDNCPTFHSKMYLLQKAIYYSVNFGKLQGTGFA